MQSDLGAFIPGGMMHIAPLATGSLSGMRFAVKDLIDIAGHVTGAGNPDWAAAQTPAEVSAPVVTMLRAAGATLIGKTITDELAFSLEGRNEHFGSPVNPSCPESLPGGSSSGSAVAVSGRLCDFALGTDTGGSVRVPGAFCNIFSMRPSHGAISLQGVVPFAPTYDTIGWFARDIDLLSRVGRVLLPQNDTPKIDEISLARDGFSLADPNRAAGLLGIARALANCPDITVFPTRWQDSSAAYSALQARDIRAHLGAEIRRLRPKFATDIAQRFAAALEENADLSPHEATRRAATQHLMRRLPPDRAVVIPTVPLNRLPLDAGATTLGAFYPPALALSAIAGHAGAAQIQIPTKYGGLSLIGAPGSDRSLLACVAELVSNWPDML